MEHFEITVTYLYYPVLIVSSVCSMHRPKLGPRGTAGGIAADVNEALGSTQEEATKEQEEVKHV